MIVSKITEAVIYESPNGEETIYVKEHNDKQHKLASKARGVDLHAQMMEDKLWGNIRRAAKTNPTLQHALNEAVLIYTLSK